VERWTPYQKLLFIFLFSNELCPTAGVYYITRKRIHLMTDIPLKELDRYLIIDGTKNLSYDAHHNVVFVHNKWKYNRRGRPDLIEKSIIGDYYANPKARQIWREFRDVYRRDITSSNELNEHFFRTINLDDENPMPLLLGSTPLTPYSGDFKDDQEREGEIQKLLNYYMRTFPSKDTERLLRVFDYFSRAKGSDKPMQTSTRLDRIQFMSRQPYELIAKALWLFEEASGVEKGLPWKYFKEIVAGGAKNWYEDMTKEIENRAENDIGRARKLKASRRSAQDQP
jgi:hypothetical protein